MPSIVGKPTSRLLLLVFGAFCKVSDITLTQKKHSYKKNRMDYCRRLVLRLQRTTIATCKLDHIACYIQQPFLRT